MKEINLIPGTEGDDETAFCREKMNAAGISNATLSHELINRLGPFAALLGEAKGFAVVLRGEDASLVGIDDSQPETP